MQTKTQGIFLSGLAIFLAGCGVQQEQPQRTELPPIIRESAGARRETRDNSETLRQRQLEFLNRIRQSDPQFQTIERALFNERNELGLVLDRKVEMESIPRLMEAMLTQMASAFPGQDLTIIAYAPATPPVKIGTGRLDAQTRRMTFTWDNPPPNQRLRDSDRSQRQTIS
jgi:hypothetical protein